MPEETFFLRFNLRKEYELNKEELINRLKPYYYNEIEKYQSDANENIRKIKYEKEKYILEGAIENIATEFFNDYQKEVLSCFPDEYNEFINYASNHKNLYDIFYNVQIDHETVYFDAENMYIRPYYELESFIRRTFFLEGEYASENIAILCITPKPFLLNVNYFITTEEEFYYNGLKDLFRNKFEEPLTTLWDEAQNYFSNCSLEINFNFRDDKLKSRFL